MRIRFTWKDYPMSPELTAKSQRVGTFTHPLYGFILAAILGYIPFSMKAYTVAMFIWVGGMIAFPILLNIYRKKKYAEYDAEYERILQSMRKN